MLRSCVVALLSSSLLTTPILAAPCKGPFANPPTSFALVESLSCTSETSPVVANIVQGSVPSTSYVTPDCSKESPYFKMMVGSLEVQYSDPLPNALSNIVQVRDFCQSGKNVFMISRHPGLLVLPSGKRINTALRVFAEDDLGSLIGYVAASENNPKTGVVLRGPDEGLLASATQRLTEVSNVCTGTWNVTNSVQQEQVANVMSFLLTLKDNQDFTCNQSPPPQLTNNCVSGGLMFGLGLLTATLFVGGVLLTVACYLKHRHPVYYRGILNRAIADNPLG